jgi:hypothetical protein
MMCADHKKANVPNLAIASEYSRWCVVKAKKTKMRNVKLQHKWRHNKYEVA